MAYGTQFFRRSAHGDLYSLNLAAIHGHSRRIWDPSFAFAEDPEIWEKANRDLVIAGAIERALLAVSGRRWQLKPASDRPEDVLLATVLEPLIQQMHNFRDSRRNLAEARFTGSSFARITGGEVTARFHDGRDRRWWVPLRLQDVDRRRVRAISMTAEQPGEESRDRRAYRYQWQIYSIARRRWEDIVHPDLFIRHIYLDRESSLGYGRGILDSIYFALYIKDIVTKEGLQGLSRWAQGLLIGSIDSLRAGFYEGQSNQDQADKLLEKIHAALGDNVLVVGDGEQVRVEWASGTGHEMVQAWLDRIEKDVIVRIEGSYMPSGGDGKGGSYAMTAEQGEKQESQRDYDRDALAETLTRQFVAFLRDRNEVALEQIRPGLSKAQTPVLEITSAHHFEASERIEAATRLAAAGGRVSLKWLHEEVKIPMADDGDDLVQAAPPSGGLDFVGGGPPPGPAAVGARARRSRRHGSQR